MRKKLIDFLGLSLIIFGIFTFFSPDLLAYQYLKQAKSDIKTWENKRKFLKKEDTMYQEAINYNKELYKNGQNKMNNIWNYRQSQVRDLNGGNCFGMIEIKKMNVKLPLYLGSTTKNMKKGATIMGETSLPLGMVNSNCVIAAHRGYQGIPYFREIEKLRIGDPVIIKNPWERFLYNVEEIKIIKPDDLDQIKIQKGKDLITLLTCHPYQKQGKYRYIVYCSRNGRRNVRKKRIIYANDFKSSKIQIVQEKIIRFFGSILLFFWVIKIIFLKKRIKIHKKIKTNSSKKARK